MNLFTSHEVNDLHDLFVDQLRDLYDAEKRLVAALPKMANAAQSAELIAALRYHLLETEGHVTRLETIFKSLSIEPKRETCAAMKGLIQEGEDIVSAKGDPAVKDAGLIAAAQRVEHYEIAGYGTARTFARQLGYKEASLILQLTLDEEARANETLNEIALRSVNTRASQARPA